MESPEEFSGIDEFSLRQAGNTVSPQGTSDKSGQRLSGRKRAGDAEKFAVVRITTAAIVERSNNLSTATQCRRASDKETKQGTVDR